MASEPERVSDRAEATHAELHRRTDRPSVLPGMRGLGAPFGEPFLAVRLGHESSDEAQQRGSRRRAMRLAAHVGAGVAPGASVRARPGKRSLASVRACVPAPVIW